MALPITRKNNIEQHLYWILHHGKFENQIEWDILNDDTESSCLVSESFQYSSYQSDQFWKNVMSNYQNDMFVFAIALGKTDPIVTLRVSTKTFINSKKLKRLCFIFNRNDIGRKYEYMKRETVINIRDKTGAIAARSVLTGLHGYNIRGKIDIPDDLDSFRIEFKTQFNCSRIPNTFIPSCITAISDMWLEEQNYSCLKTWNLHDTSDPEPGTDPNPPEPDEYARSVTPEVPANTPYEKIWFNEEGIIYKGDHVYATNIQISESDETLITEKLDQVIKNLPDNLKPDRIVITDNMSHLDTIEEIKPYDFEYMALITKIDENDEVAPIP